MKGLNMRFHLIALLITFLSLQFSFPTETIPAPQKQYSSIQLIHADKTGVVAELQTGAYEITEVAHDGELYHDLSIPGMMQSDKPGAPMVPLSGALIGILSENGIALRILDAEYEILNGYRLCPSPESKVMGDNGYNMSASDIRQIFAADRDIYDTDAFYPGSVAEVGGVAFIRDLPVVRLQFFPVQYNPVSGEIRIYRRIRVRVSWDLPAEADISLVNKKIVSPSFENLLSRTIFNYRSLGRPGLKEKVFRNDNFRIKSDTAAGSDEITTLKVSIDEDGIYKLSYQDITNAGLDVDSVEAGRIKMTLSGDEIPIYVHGGDDGSFDGSDYILFYGEGRIDDVYTDKNVYILTIADTKGERMSNKDGRLTGSGNTPSNFPATVHAEEDSFYWQTMPHGEGQDHWFWGKKLSAPEEKGFSFAIDNVSHSSDPATLRLELKGLTGISSAEPDHHTKIYFNDIEIDDQWWDGQVIFKHKVSIPQSHLINGTNTVKVELPGDTGANVDQILLNWIEADYYKTYDAKNDELVFKAPSEGVFQFEVSGFSSKEIEVFDITESKKTQRVINSPVSKNGGVYTLKFEDTAGANSRYIAASSSGFRTPVKIEADHPSTWKSVDNGADYIIITHEDFYESALKLADHRGKSGLRVVVVDVEDIYDEFNHGIFNPRAIQDFLRYTYENWEEPAPTYVMLIGDAYQDYKDNFKSGTIDYVPSQIIETDELGETPSDNWFALVSGDDIIPDMHIGRLSAQSAEQAEDIINKIINYEENPPDEDRGKRVLLVADDDQASFEALSEEIIDIVPDSYEIQRVYVSQYESNESPKDDIEKHINEGPIAVNYTGHGAVDMWGINENSSIFTVDDINKLNNDNKLPVVTVANCLNGFFTGKNTQTSVAEAFHRLKDRGSIAVWAPTALSYTSGHRLLMLSFYESVFKKAQYGLGEITLQAKLDAYTQNSFWGELMETFVLFGDPVTDLQLPANSPVPEPTPSVTPQVTVTPVPTPTSSGCVVAEIKAEPSVLKLMKGEGDTVIIAVTCKDSAPAKGIMVSAKIKRGKKRIDVLHSLTETDNNGQAVFEISAKKEGTTLVEFSANGLNVEIKVKVERKK